MLGELKKELIEFLCQMISICHKFKMKDELLDELKEAAELLEAKVFKLESETSLRVYHVKLVQQEITLLLA